MADAERGARLAIAWHPHHAEHLAPWCELLDMPLLLSDGEHLDGIADDYPVVRVERARGADMSRHVAMFAHAIRKRAPSAIFYSELFSRTLLRALFGGRRDAPRIVYVPHGFSEKRQDWARGTAFQDVAVLYGRHAYDQLEALGVADDLGGHVFCGNLRAGYHRRHAPFFRERVAPLGLDGPRPSRTLLYAPTWHDAIGSSSFATACAAFVTGLPAGWRLIVKLHPHLERDAAGIEALAATIRGRDVHLVRAHPLCFPFLDLADAYVGDMSSLAYDFLAYGRPMFFTNPTAGQATDAAGSRLFACGTVIAPDRYGDLYRIVDDAWAGDAARFGEARVALDAYTHAPGRAPDELAAEIDTVLDGEAPSWMHAPPGAPSAAAG